MILYHGSKGGIKGNIKPCSRDNCDFGRGFYMGENELQTQLLIHNAAYPVFYQIEYNENIISKDKILVFKADELWLNFVLYNRGVYDTIRGTEFYDNIANVIKGKELIIGPIADDSFRSALRSFENDECTDVALLDALSHNEFKNQYVPITEKSCKGFNIISERIPTLEEIKILETKAQNYRDYGYKIFLEAKNRNWNKGKRLCDIINEVKEHDRGHIHR